MLTESQLFSPTTALSSILPEGSVEVHLNHARISNQIISRFALRGENDVECLRKLLIRHSNVRSFRYASTIQNLGNDRSFRRGTRKYVSKDLDFVTSLNPRTIKAWR